MDLVRRLLGSIDPPEQERAAPVRGQGGPPSRSPRPVQSDDERAIERYRYLLRTAPPETLEAAHAEAFAQLTPEQRRQVLEQLTADLPPAERPTNADDPRSLARAATRAEMRRPGTLERQFGGMGGGMGGGIGMGGLMAGSFLSTIAGVMVGSAIANAFFADSGYTDGAGAEDAAADTGDAGADAGADAGGDAGFDAGDDTGGDTGFDAFGGDVAGDFGGDFGDFGGGEF